MTQYFSKALLLSAASVIGLSTAGFATNQEEENYANLEASVLFESAEQKIKDGESLTNEETAIAMQFGLLSMDDKQESVIDQNMLNSINENFKRGQWNTNEEQSYMTKIHPTLIEKGVSQEEALTLVESDYLNNIQNVLQKKLQGKSHITDQEIAFLTKRGLVAPKPAPEMQAPVMQQPKAVAVPQVSINNDALLASAVGKVLNFAPPTPQELQALKNAHMDATYKDGLRLLSQSVMKNSQMMAQQQEAQAQAQHLAYDPRPYQINNEIHVPGGMPGAQPFMHNSGIQQGNWNQGYQFSQMQQEYLNQGYQFNQMRQKIPQHFGYSQVGMSYGQAYNPVFNQEPQVSNNAAPLINNNAAGLQKEEAIHENPAVNQQPVKKLKKNMQKAESRKLRKKRSILVNGGITEKVGALVTQGYFSDGAYQYYFGNDQLSKLRMHSIFYQALRKGNAIANIKNPDDKKEWKEKLETLKPYFISMQKNRALKQKDYNIFQEVHKACYGEACDDLKKPKFINKPPKPSSEEEKAEVLKIQKAFSAGNPLEKEQLDLLFEYDGITPFDFGEYQQIQWLMNKHKDEGEAVADRPEFKNLNFKMVGGKVGRMNKKGEFQEGWWDI